VFDRLRMPSLGGATEWLNSEPLGPAEPDRVRCSSPCPTFPSRETFCARLTRVSPGHRRVRADRPSRVLAGVLIAVALVALVVCLATDVLV
jgi:hypothetical protein